MQVNFFTNELKWLNIEVYNNLSKGFAIRSDKKCFCEIAGEFDGTIVTRVKHTIRQKTHNLWCLTWGKHSCQIRLTHGNIAKRNDYV